VPRILRLFAVLWLAASASACRPDDGPPKDGPVEVLIWHKKDGVELDFFNRQVAAFNREHDGRIRIKTLKRDNEELRTQFIFASVGGQGPDLIFGPSDNISVFAVTGSLRPVTDVLPDTFLARFDSSGVLDWNGKKWLVADQVGNHLAFVYNKRLLPAVPETWEELIPMLQALTKDTTGDGRPDRYGLTWNYTEPFFFVPFLTGAGGWVMTPDEKPTLDTPQTVEAIRFVLDLRDKYKIIPGESDYNVAETLFKEGRAAAVINGPWAWAGYKRAGIDYGIARIPKMPGGRWSAPVTSSLGYSVNVNVPDWKVPYLRTVLEFLTGPAMQTAMADSLATIPTQPQVLAIPKVAENPILQASLAQLAVGRPMPLTPQMRQVWDGMRGPYQLVMSGSVSPEQGARKMQVEVQNLMDDMSR